DSGSSASLCLMDLFAMDVPMNLDMQSQSVQPQSRAALLAGVPHDSDSGRSASLYSWTFLQWTCEDMEAYDFSNLDVRDRGVLISLPTAIHDGGSRQD
ncbi:hypothetical protein LTR40_013045, partial [Exophiala xenobiotica]